MKKKIIIFILVIVSLVLIIFSIPVLLAIFKGRDAPSIDDHNIELSIIDVAENQNGFYDLEKIDDLLNIDSIPDNLSLRDDYLDINKWDKKVLNKVLADNEAVFGFYSSAAEKPKIQVPFENNSKTLFQTKIIKGLSWRRSSYLLALKSIYEASESNYKKALNDSFRVITVGDKIISFQPTPMTILIGLSIKEVGFKTLERVLDTVDIDSKELIKFQEKLDNYDTKNNTSFLKMSYLNIKDEIIKMKNGEIDFEEEIKLPSNKYYFKPNLTLSYFYKYYDEEIIEFEKSCEEFQGVEPEEIMGDLDSFTDMLKLYITENAVGKIIYKMSILSDNNVKKKQCELENKFNNLKIKIEDKIGEMIEKETKDTDGDGLLDREENKYGTDINNPDTDGDGYSDGDEVQNGFNPNGPGRLKNNKK